MTRFFRITRVATLLMTATAATVPSATWSQSVSQTDAASLVADSISVTEDGALVASGNVEIFYQDAHLTAKTVTYLRDEEKLIVEGPLRITRGTEAIVLADSAELDADMQRGIVRGARLVLDERLQLAASSIKRVDGRYTQLYKSVASSCEVCAQNPTPLWEIRSESIVHDQVEQQLYFDKAQLRVMGVPIFYLPNMRLPDPTLERSRGFLVPSAVSDSNLGYGLRLPYFIPLGDSKDLTLAPLVTTNSTTVEYRYRQAFENGEMEFEGAISRDELEPDETRGYLFGEGEFAMPNDFVLGFQAEIVSDSDYLLSYDFSDSDLLNSYIDLTRVRRNEYINTTLSKAQSLRDADDNSTLPNLAFDATYERLFQPSYIGGTATLTGAFHGHQRSSETDIEGRDLQRGSLYVNWKRTELWGPGMLFTAGADLGVDVYAIQQDSTYASNETYTTGTLGAELRWPHMKTGSNGVKHLFEPIAQVFYSPLQDDLPPNEDSQESTLDEGNLLSMSRFAGFDRQEAGTWANLGFTYKRIDPSGVSLGATVGRVVRSEDPELFNDGSGLEGTKSDWLASVEIGMPGKLSLASHALIDDDFSFTRNETLLTYKDDRYNISTGYLWLTPEPAIDRDTVTSEWTFDADYIINDTWSGDVSWRYDLYRESAAEAGFGLTYQNECIVVDLSLSHRFTSSDNVDPSTSVGMTVALTGFGSSGSKSVRKARNCTRYN